MEAPLEDIYFLKISNTYIHTRPVGSFLKLGWPIKCLFPPKVGVAHFTFWLRSAKSWGGPGHPGYPSTYGPAKSDLPLAILRILQVTNLELYITIKWYFKVYIEHGCFRLSLWNIQKTVWKTMVRSCQNIVQFRNTCQTIGCDLFKGEARKRFTY